MSEPITFGELDDLTVSPVFVHLNAVGGFFAEDHAELARERDELIGKAIQLEWQFRRFNARARRASIEDCTKVACHEA